MKKVFKSLLVVIIILGLLPTSFANAEDLGSRLKGKLLLQVNQGGRIWYVNPTDSKRFEITFANALPLFENFALGITNKDLDDIPKHSDDWTSVVGNRLKGKLLLQVEQSGRIWYVDFNGKRWEVTWANLMTLFESLALGITDEDLNQISTGDLDNQSSSTEEEYDYYLVTRIIDGDTIEVNIDGTTEAIRLIGMDTPETKDPRKPVQCFGQEASDKTTELLLNKEIRLESDSTQNDRGKYGRLIRYIYTQDNIFFNKWMVENGYAYEYTYGTPYQYQQEFKNAQIYAENNQLGLWSPDTCNGSTKLDSDPAEEQTTEHIWYTSSHHTAEYYYCDTDSTWESLSESYLKQFNSEEELLNNYERVLHEPCQ
jgi:endonuclease YncB( thermonuclease family)